MTANYITRITLMLCAVLAVMNWCKLRQLNSLESIERQHCALLEMAQHRQEVAQKQADRRARLQFIMLHEEDIYYEN